MANHEDKMKALDAALGQIERQYGKGAVMKLGDSGANMNVETVPTGAPEPGHRPGTGRRAQGQDCGDLRAGVLR